AAAGATTTGAAGTTGTAAAVAAGTLKSKAVAAALILGSIGVVAATTAVVARNRRTTQTLYLDPAPANGAVANVQGSGNAATPPLQSTGGHVWRPQSVRAADNPGAIHDVFLRSRSGGGWNLDSFTFAPAARPALARIDAVTFNQADGIETRGGAVTEAADG